MYEYAHKHTYNETKKTETSFLLFYFYIFFFRMIICSCIWHLSLSLSFVTSSLNLFSFFLSIYNSGSEVQRLKAWLKPIMLPQRSLSVSRKKTLLVQQLLLLCICYCSIGSFVDRLVQVTITTPTTFTTKASAGKVNFLFVEAIESTSRFQVIVSLQTT